MHTHTLIYVCFMNSLVLFQRFDNEQKEKQKDYPNRFCYICGRVTLPDQHSDITKFVKSCYHAYFGIRIGDQDKSFAHHTCCKTCVENLRRSRGKVKSLPFGVPMVCREGTDHLTDCYFYMTNLQGKLIFENYNDSFDLILSLTDFKNICTIEERYQGRWYINMLADYCWCLKRDLPGEKHKRKSLKTSFLPH